MPKFPKNKIIFLAVMIFFGVLFFAKSSLAATYYVATTGNDSNAGTSASPWKTIQKAANTMVAGDTVLVQPGTYSERVSSVRSGTSGKPITFRANGAVSMKGFDISHSYISVYSFEITGHLVQAEGGVMFGSGSSNCIISGCDIHDNDEQGVWLEGTNHLIENNNIHHTHVGGDADGMRVFGSGHIIRGNYIHDIPPGGSDPHTDCFQTWNDPCYDILIENNICDLLTSTGRAQVANLDIPVRWTFRNNIFMNVKAGINNYNGQYFPGTKSMITVINNTFYQNSDYAVNLYNNTGSSVKNNIFLNCSRKYLDTDSSNDVGYNLVYNGGSAPPGSPYPNDLWNVNPQLTNPSRGNFSPLPGSPVCGAGYNGVDIGAVPCSGSSDTTPPAAPTGVTIS